MDFEKKFTALFKSIAPQYRRSEVFYDFITIFALEFYLILYGAQADESLRQRYQTAAGHYNEDEKQALSRLFNIIVEALEHETYDFLGSVFMALDLGDQYKAQYFTPSHIAHLMAAVTLYDFSKFERPGGAGIDGRNGPERQGLARVLEAAIEHYDKMKN